MKIGVVLPTRGIVLTEVMDSLLGNLKGIDYQIYFSWNLGIPECENVLVDKALAEDVTHVLFIEEDTVIPEGGLKKILELDSDIACIDYGVAGWGCVTRSKETNEVLWCGLGCTLVKRNVFEKLEKPYFRSDKALLLNFWPEIRWIDSGKQVYGGQDIWFCTMARQNGFKIQQVEGMECKHLRLGDLGRPEINNGLHKIVQKPVITKKQTL